MSDTANTWGSAGPPGSEYMDTPVGRALISKIAGSDSWSARVETSDGTRQSPELASRLEAEAWVEQQVIEAQRMA